MAEDPLDTLRLFLMQDVLPVGMAMAQRAKEGGASKVAEPFSSVEDPLRELKKEGETAAKTVREQLDRVRPGLGNPVVPVKVAVDVDNSQIDQQQVHKPLIECLDRIQVGMEESENLLIFLHFYLNY